MFLPLEEDLSKDTMEYKCEKCGATFRDPDALEKHKVVHEIRAKDISVNNQKKEEEQPTAEHSGLPRPPSPTPSPQPSPTPKPVE